MFTLEVYGAIEPRRLLTQLTFKNIGQIENPTTKAPIICHQLQYYMNSFFKMLHWNPYWLHRYSIPVVITLSHLRYWTHFSHHFYSPFLCKSIHDRLCSRFQMQTALRIGVTHYSICLWEIIWLQTLCFGCKVDSCVEIFVLDDNQHGGSISTAWAYQ